jgi:hypothetical protein
MTPAQQVILHLVKRLPELGRTQIVKLLYLVDLESHRQLGRPITGAQWKFHHHGPYWSGFIPALEQLERTGHLEPPRRFEFAGGTGYSYRATDGKAGPASEFSPAEEAILAYVVREFGQRRLATLLEVVYDTPPMKGAQRGRRLNMRMVDLEGVIEAGGISLDDVVTAQAQLARGEGITLEELRRELHGRPVAES